MNKRVLCVAADGFEEIELVTPVDLLRRAGVEVVIVSLHEKLVKGRNGIVLQADLKLSEIDSSQFDLLFVPGGPAVGELRRDGSVVELARQFFQNGKWVAAICAAPLVLLDAGLLDGKEYTAHFSTAGELAKILPDRVVVDGLIITSRGAGTALDFGFKLVDLLVGTEVTSEVSQAIMA
ncbi:DJ-1/PfpI family protein [Luteolibacter pohnpeiensis]|uniref:DJ-1/PfpI family protein n=1 Tax=Luteolibacter pohnpeiensis TaxID=454153 RepID=A0A934S999_9BACT|nr:DJ-1 family glyoxalase III [Luteolibacter pohnpeiensis]MBK1883604.1 DJ-1/PfpI family protein [Luteolibacter pohnpeiensis]